MTPVIRPYYRADQFCGFLIWAFNEHEQQYEPAGQPFKQYKLAQLALIDIVAEMQLELHDNNKVA